MTTEDNIIIVRNILLTSHANYPPESVNKPH